MKEEVMTPNRKNPMLKVKAPKVVLDPLEPISIPDVRALISTCQRGDLIGERDQAIFLFLSRMLIRYWRHAKEIIFLTRRQVTEPKLAEVLLHLLNDDDSGVRRQAVRAAAGRAEPELQERLRTMTVAEKDAGVRAEAAAVLRQRE